MNMDGFVTLSKLNPNRHTPTPNSGERTRYMTGETVVLRTEYKAGQTGPAKLTVLVSMPVAKQLGWKIGEPVRVLVNPATQMLLLKTTQEDKTPYKLHTLSPLTDKQYRGETRPTRITFTAWEALGVKQEKIKFTEADFDIQEGALLIEIPDTMLSNFSVALKEAAAEQPTKWNPQQEAA